MSADPTASAHGSGAASTRRAAIAAAAGGALAWRAGTAFAAAPDRGALNALAAYQQAVVAGYDALREQANGAERQTLEKLRGRAAAASAVLPKTRAAPPAPDASLHGLVATEEAFVAACYTALQTLTDERHLKGCAALMADAGRRLVALRQMAGKPLLPRSFETGTA